MSNFFIDRPVFAWVLAIVMMMLGGFAITQLPVSQYPSVAPPQVRITAMYPGASAKTLEDTVTQVIEQNMTGLDGLLYMSSTSDSSGTAEITLTFQNGTNPDIAQVQVQNKLQLATALLPQEVQQQGLEVQKASTGFLMVLAFVSTDGKLDRIDLADLISSIVLDPIGRTQGVGQAQLFGSAYAMRIWLNANKLNEFGLTTVDVSNAISAQNVQVAAGELGGTPAVEGQALNATIVAQTRLETPEQFRQILLRVNPDGSQVRLEDVARVELGGENYQFASFYNRMPAAGLAISLAPGANALDTAQAVRDVIERLKPLLPADVEVRYPYDTTPFVKLSIEEVVKTLIEAIVLVFFVMYLFLQNLRATLVPTLAVPVVLLGTFAMMYALGFSINTLTMFGMVLAIGLLVDDAIVVVENVERVMAEEHLSPLEATRKSMQQISGALVGIGVVLTAVFVPMAFLPGSTGVIYRQFSLTIATAMILSVLTALIFTPSLCAMLLRPHRPDEGARKRGPLGRFFGGFNRGFDHTVNRYERGVRGMLLRPARYLLVYVLIVVGMALLYMRIPSSFLPEEDQGILIAQIMLPAGATQQRTLETVRAYEDYILEKEKDNVESVFAVAGFSFAGRGQNMALAFMKLKDWEEREGDQNSAQAIARRAMAAFAPYRDALVFTFAPPAIIELGTATGFDFQLKDVGGLGHEALAQAQGQLLAMAAKEPSITGLRPNGMPDTPQFKVDINQEKASALSLSLADVNNTLATALGSSYVNDFIDRGRVKRVYVQADAPFRMMPQDIQDWYVRNGLGQMVPFSAFSDAHWIYGSPRLTRYNGVPAMEILGEPAPGYSSGTAMAAMERLASQLPSGIGYEWTGMSYQERISGNQAPMLYAVSLVVVFLCLAALYESWSIPVAVMMVVPLGIVGALLATTLRGLSNDVYFKVGLLTTVGLSAKNAILIVEFAKDLQAEGMNLIDATLHAARQRLRPIVMTSMAFILGVLPLAMSTGAGAGGQNAIGTGVIGGMLTATILAVFLVPVFFVVVRRLTMRSKPPTEDDGKPPEQHGTRFVEGS